jgi:hypothetical protein
VLVFILHHGVAHTHGVIGSHPAKFGFPRALPLGYDAGMGDDRKNPPWPWIVALLIGLPVLYVASFGPACWTTVRHRSLHSAFSATFRPLLWTAEHFPAAVMSLLDKYALLGMPEPSVITLPRKNPSLLAKGWTVISDGTGFLDDAANIDLDMVEQSFGTDPDHSSN